MNYSALPDFEKRFHTTLTDSEGKLFKLNENIKLTNSEIRKISTSYDSYYYKEKKNKNLIVLHGTIGAIKGDVASLTKKDSGMGVSYLISRDGIIYELFDPHYWSYHTGKGTVGGNTEISSRSIGIELSNYGPLVKKGLNLDTIYSEVAYKDKKGNPQISPKDTYCTINDFNQYTHLDTPYRGYEYFAQYTDKQYKALNDLINYLTTMFNIPKTFVDVTRRFEAFDEATAKSFKGIATHVNYRTSGKWDLGPDFKWNMIVSNDTITKPVIPNPSIIPTANQPIQWLSNTATNDNTTGILLNTTKAKVFSWLGGILGKK